MQSLLDGLVSSVRGAEAALLLDSEGEVVIEAGARNPRHRLIGAYQGIALSTARRTGARYASGAIHYILCRYAWGHVLMRPLKDGYYLVVALSPDGNVGQGLHRSAQVQERLNAEL
jgi:predicted regulator of Ras-like GTPase activity (Roadblock/LC7/MglB family)